MSLLLETSLGDIVIDLDVDHSPTLCHNVLKLAKARYYTNTLIYNVQPGRFCQMGDPAGDGSGGCSIYGLIDATLEQNKLQMAKASKASKVTKARESKIVVDVRKSKKRFLRSKGHGVLTQNELCEKGRVVVTNMGNVKNTIGSQFLITVDSGPDRALDGIGIASNSNSNNDGGNNMNDNHAEDSSEDGNGSTQKHYYSLGQVVEDDNDVLSQINNLYCDKHGRPYTDVRIIRMHVLDDPYNNGNNYNDDKDGEPEGMKELLQQRGVKLIDKNDLPNQYTACSNWISCASPNYEKPDEEVVEERIKFEDAMVDVSYDEDGEVVVKVDAEKEQKRQQEILKKEDKSNAVLLEMLGDIASADAKPPENVLFVCKLNPMTEDEDLQLIFSRFDPDAKAEIIRDPDTGSSLQYAFVEFETKEACTEAYFKMNNALIDDRRIKVDFSQSVSKEWNRFTQRKRHGGHGGGNNFNYRNDRANYRNKPREEKKYYGGFKQQNQTNNNHRDHNRNNKIDDNSRRREREYNHDDRKRKRSLSLSPSNVSAADSSLSNRRDSRRRKKSDNDDRDRRDRHRRHDRDDKHHRKKKHKHRRRHRDDDNDNDHGNDDDKDRERGRDRRRDKHKSSKRKHKSSSRRKRSRSKDRGSGQRRRRSRSISHS